MQLKHRDVDIVIRNEKCMANFLKLLIYQLKTVDGNRNSAVPIQRALYKQRFKELYDNGSKMIEDWRKKQIMDQAD